MSIVIPTSEVGVTTVYDIIRQAMKDIGAIGGRETPTPDEAQDGLSTLNQMLAMWRTQSLTVYCQKQESITATGALSYTIGDSGDLDIERPYAIDAAYWLDNGVSTPLVPIHSFEDYQDIGVKELSGTPSAFYYRPDFPLGQLFVWPSVNTGSIVLTMRVPMPIYADIYEEISLPAEYLGAIRWNLAMMLCSTFGLNPNASVVMFAKQTKRALKIINTQLKTMRMPDAVMPTTLYNIRSGA
jgi:hypothetical protein